MLLLFGFQPRTRRRPAARRRLRRRRPPRRRRRSRRRSCRRSTSRCPTRTDGRTPRRARSPPDSDPAAALLLSDTPPLRPCGPAALPELSMSLQQTSDRRDGQRWEYEASSSVLKDPESSPRMHVEVSRSFSVGLLYFFLIHSCYTSDRCEYVSFSN